jgi:hypothetical protein
MRCHLRVVASLIIALSTYAILLRALRWMSLPSDRGWYGGIAVVLGLLLLVPFLIRFVWRKL